MAQRGQVNLGGVGLSAGVPNVKTFLDSMPKGIPVGRIAQRFAFTLISTAAAFNLAVDSQGSAAAEGVDDTDILLNALFSQWYYEWSAGKPVGSSMTPAQWRTIFGAISRRDFEGSFANGISVTATGGTPRALYIDVLFPVSMATMFQGGGMTTRGSDAMRTASWQYSAGSSLTPTVVLTNGSAIVGGLSISLVLYGGLGTGGDVGPTWQITRRNSLPLPYDFPEANRLALLDTTPGSSYSGAAISFWDYVNAAPADFTTRFQSDILGVSGAVYDISARVLPYYIIKPDDSVNILSTRYGKPTRLEVASGITSTSVYDLTLEEPHAATVATVGQTVGGGGAVATTRVQPHGLDEGLAETLMHLAPIRIAPAAAASKGSNVHANAQSAASGVADSNAKAAGVKASIGSLFGRR